MPIKSAYTFSFVSPSCEGTINWAASTDHSINRTHIPNAQPPQKLIAPHLRRAPPDGFNLYEPPASGGRRFRQESPEAIHNHQVQRKLDRWGAWQVPRSTPTVKSLSIIYMVLISHFVVSVVFGNLILLYLKTLCYPVFNDLVKQYIFGLVVVTCKHSCNH